VGLILTLLRWRRYLLLAPALALGLSLLPGVADRALEGLSHNTDTGPAEEVDVETLTAGRNLFWPLVIDKIAEQPIVGHGRKAMERTGLSAAVVEELGENGPDNPHSAYLEMLLDCGWVGLAVTLALFGYILVNSLSLIRDRRSTVFIAIGGVTSALVIAQLVGSVTGQSFYPREGTLGMWCAIGLMLRVAVERARALATSAFVGTKSVRSLNWWTTGPSPLPPSTTVPRPIGEAQGWWQPTPSSPATSLDAYLWSESTGHPALQEHTICEAR
jgi:O-antigen ligase